MKKFFEEFKTFISQGNVLDMAVGVIIGGAFKGIVDSLVNDILSPLIGIAGGANLSNLSVNIGGATLTYGNFISSVINFVLMALIIFLIVKTVNGARKKLTPKKPEEAPKTKMCPYCRSEIDINATRCPHCTSELDK